MLEDVLKQTAMSIPGLNIYCDDCAIPYNVIFG